MICKERVLRKEGKEILKRKVKVPAWTVGQLERGLAGEMTEDLLLKNILIPPQIRETCFVRKIMCWRISWI